MGNYELMCFLDCFLNDNNANSYQIDGYKFTERHRTSTVGGGVGMYLSHRLKFKLRDDISVILWPSHAFKAGCQSPPKPAADSI